jgi:alkylation response protein AidB-like acyl-CoA dehydrogenase
MRSKMYYQLTEEQKRFKESVRRLAKERVEPRAREIDQKGEFAWDIFEIFKKQGYFGLCIPELYGGQTSEHIYVCIAIEEVARVCVSSSLIIQVQALGTFPIMIGGSEDQKKKYGPLLARGERIIDFGLTEPGAGSDASMMTTKAELSKDRYILNGMKHFMSNGPVVTTMVVFAMTDPSKGVRGISAFIVEKEESKFVNGKVESKMGIRGAPTSEILFHDCAVPKENLLGEEGKGFRIAMAALDYGRPTIAAQAVGLAQGAMEKAIQYAKERVQFGKPIAEFQGIQWMFADMACRIEAARALTYQACNMIDQNDPQKTYMSACCKLLASDVAMKATTDAVQIAGGYGYMTDFPFERMMRDAKITQIYEGTNQIQKIVIARELLR